MPLLLSVVIHAIVIVLLVKAGVLRLPATVAVRGGGGTGEAAEWVGDGNAPPSENHPQSELPQVSTATTRQPHGSTSFDAPLPDVIPLATPKSPAALLYTETEPAMIGVSSNGDNGFSERFPQHLPAQWTSSTGTRDSTGDSASNARGSNSSPLASGASKDANISGTGGGAVGIAGMPRGRAGNKPPAYPADARRKKQQGTVWLLVEVREDGSVGHLSVDQSSGYELLDRTAADAVRKWRFNPELVDGRAIPSVGRIPIEFGLRD